MQASLQANSERSDHYAYAGLAGCFGSCVHTINLSDLMVSVELVSLAKVHLPGGDIDLCAYC